MVWVCTLHSSITIQNIRFRDLFGGWFLYGSLYANVANFYSETLFANCRTVLIYLQILHMFQIALPCVPHCKLLFWIICFAHIANCCSNLIFANLFSNFFKLLFWIICLSNFVNHWSWSYRCIFCKSSFGSIFAYWWGWASRIVCLCIIFINNCL